MAAVWINMTNVCLVGSPGQVSWAALGDVGSRHLIVSDNTHYYWPRVEFICYMELPGGMDGKLGAVRQDLAVGCVSETGSVWNGQI